MTDATSSAERIQKLHAAAERRQALLATQRQNQLIPENTVSANALTVVIAIMSFLACLTLGAVTLVRDAAHNWQSDVEREVTIQVLPIDGVDTATETARAAALARKTSGIASVRVLDSAANARLLEPWLGSGLDLSSLPIPRLIVVKLTSPGAADLAALAARLKSQVKGATLDDHGAWVSRLQSMASVTVFAGLAILGLEFAWARRWLRHVKERSGQMAAWISNSANGILRRNTGARGRAQAPDPERGRSSEPPTAAP